MGNGGNRVIYTVADDQRAAAAQLPPSSIGGVSFSAPLGPFDKVCVPVGPRETLYLKVRRLKAELRQLEAEMNLL